MRRKHLLVINYTMDTQHPILSHSVDVVYRLAQEFEYVHVITLGKRRCIAPFNVTILELNFQELEFRLFKLIRLVWGFCSYLFQKKTNFLVFTHMAEQAHLPISILCRLFGINNYLWYAHRDRPRNWRLIHRFTSKLLSSTPGSFPCPKSPKVVFIGQGLPIALFPKEEFDKSAVDFVTVGRLDPSKNVELLIEFFCSLLDEQRCSADSIFHIYGEPTPENRLYAEELIHNIRKGPYKHNFKFHGSVPRSELNSAVGGKLAFLHAFSGSLDKAIVESTLIGTPVITANKEYLRELGQWNTKNFDGSSIPNILKAEFSAFMEFDQKSIQMELDRRINLARENHSIESWGEKLISALEK